MFDDLRGVGGPRVGLEEEREFIGNFVLDSELGDFAYDLDVFDLLDFQEDQKV